MAGQVRSIVPGNVKVFKSSDMKTWTEMAVDYRAVGAAGDSCPAPTSRISGWPRITA